MDRAVPIILLTILYLILAGGGGILAFAIFKNTFARVLCSIFIIGIISVFWFVIMASPDHKSRESNPQDQDSWNQPANPLSPSSPAFVPFFFSR